MRAWRKNRTQYAKLFIVNREAVLGFLVGDYQGIQHIETLKGKQITISAAGEELKNNVVDDDFTEEIEKWENGKGEALVRKYKSGLIVSRQRVYA